MHSTKFFIFLAVGLLFVNARVLKCQKKIARRITKLPPSSLVESMYGCLGTCGYNDGPCGRTGPCGCSGPCCSTGPRVCPGQCAYNGPCGCTGPCGYPGSCGYPGPCGCPGQCDYPGPCGCKSPCRNIFLNDLPGYNMNYGKLNPVTTCDRIPVIKLPKTYSSIDVGPIPIPAINLPSLCQCEVPCQCQNIPYNLLEAPCSYLKSFDVNSPIIKIPIESIQYIEGPNYQTVSVCGCQTACGCKCKCGCQLAELDLPCGCQTCQLPAISGLQLPPPSVPFACQLTALENPYAYQLPALDVSCGCQSSGCCCQLPGCGCQSSGCGGQSPGCGCGKYLRQITLQPPFL